MRVWLIVAISLAFVSLCHAADAQRPNILFIFADDHSPRTVSCYEDAYPMARTPHIDALAASGVRFQGAYLGSWCMPSRASLLTGLLPHAIESMRMEGRYPGSTYDPAQCRFWPAVFRQHGYQTAQIGKWHTGTDTGWGRDWDFQIVWNRPKNPENAGSYYKSQVTEFNGQERMVEGYSTDNYTDWAVDYIRGKDRDAEKPWYLWLCYGAIHGPTTPAKRHRGTLEGERAQAPDGIFGPREGLPSYLDDTQAWIRGPYTGEPLSKNGKLTLSAWVQQVNECMQAVDEGVGRVMAALRESGQLENTLVIYTSDQGFANGEHGLKQKVAPYETAYRSPLVVSRPGTLPQGKYCPQPVSSPDLIVTFFAQAGIELPWKMHGRDITPLLVDPGTQWDSPVLFEHFGHDYGSAVTAALSKSTPQVHAKVPYFVAIRQGRHKYVRYLGAKEPDELYDLAADPEELTNLAAEPAHRATRDRLRQLLVDELERTDAEFAARVDRP